MTPTDPTPVSLERVALKEIAEAEPFDPWDGWREVRRLRDIAADALDRAERAAQPSAALRELAARIRAEQAALPVAVIEPGEVLATLPDGRLLTERQRGSLQGQGAALGWVLNQIAALQPAPAPTPVEPPVDDLGAAWAEAEAAVRAIGGWFIVTSYDDLPGIYTVEARRWIVGARHPDALVDQPARIFKQPLIPALRSLAARLAATKAGPS